MQTLFHGLSLSLVLLAAGAQKPRGPDTVEVTNGKPIAGRVVFEGDEFVVVQSGRGEFEVERTKVAAVRSIERSLVEFIRRFDALSKTDAAALSELAQWCAANALEHEARNLWLRVLALDPTREAAIAGSGARKRGASLQVQSGRDWLDLDAFRGAKAKWRDAVELRTAHFQITTDHPIDLVLDVSVQLERHYARFYDFLGADLLLYVFSEVPEVRIYTRDKDFPLPWVGGERCWFAPGENVLHALAVEPYDLRQIVREVTEMLIFNAARRSSGKTGQMPAWAAAGLSDFFGATAAEQVGGPWLELGTPNVAFFRVHASQRDPIELKRLFTSSWGEIRRGTMRRSAPRRPTR